MKKSNTRKNIKLYPIYKMISWDLVFYYAISLLFLTDEKHLSASEVLFADSFFILFKSFFQLPCLILINKLGKKNSLIIGNICMAIYTLLVLGCTNLTIYFIADIILSLGYVIKNICESNILYESIPESNNRRKIFSKFDGLGSSLYYIFDAITSVASGFLYIINPYIPMIICFVFSIISVILSCMFAHTTNVNEEDKVRSAHYFKDIFSAFKYILHSKRLRSLIIFNAFFASLFPIIATYRRSFLNDINISPKYIGIIFAVLGLIAGASSKRVTKFHKSFRNKTLTFISVPTTLSLILSGVTLILDLPYSIMIIVLLFSFAIQYMNKGPYYTLIKQYLSSFSTSNMRLKIYSANSLIEGIIGFIFSFSASYILGITSTANAAIIMGCIYTVSIFLILKYMKTRVGLQPEEYSKKDINYVEIK